MKYKVTSKKTGKTYTVSRKRTPRKKKGTKYT